MKRGAYLHSSREILWNILVISWFSSLHKFNTTSCITPQFTGAGKSIAKWKNTCQRSTWNACHIVMDRSNSSTTSTAWRLFTLTTNRIRIKKKTLEGVLDVGTIGAGSSVSLSFTTMLILCNPKVSFTMMKIINRCTKAKK